jgi:hypothetical protein
MFFPLPLIDGIQFCHSWALPCHHSPPSTLVLLEKWFIDGSDNRHYAMRIANHEKQKEKRGDFSPLCHINLLNAQYVDMC